MADPTPAPVEGLRVARRGVLGLLTLDRPRALNALTLPMVRGLAAALAAFARDEGVRVVAIRGEGSRAFCAGGDVRGVREAVLAARADEADAFFREEYALNATIKRYPKPFVALVDGICMGGGIGVSMHGALVALGEGARLAMPETGIGFVPDIGATWLLPRLTPPFGAHLALTGLAIGRNDALAAGLGTHAVPAAAFDAVLDALAGGEEPGAVLAAVAGGAGPSALAPRLAELAGAYDGEEVPAILARLDAAPGETAAEAARAIRSRSPTSLALALAMLRRGMSLSFEEALALELRVVTRVIRGHDFPEGVRAVLVDKDSAPRWSPAGLEEVDGAAVAALVAPTIEPLGR